MKALMSLFKMDWEPWLALVLCLSIVGLVGYQRHKINALERDNASLQQTIALTKAIGQAQNEKADRIEQGAHQAAILSTNQYLSDLEKVKKYNASHPSIKYVTVNGVRQSTTNTCSRQVPPAGTGAEGADDASADPIPVERDIVADCRLTTLQLLHLQKFELEQQGIH